MGAISSFVGNIGWIWGASGASASVFWESFIVLAVFLLGAVVGILGFSKFLHWLLARWHKETLVVLAGFILGSLVKVWPWNNPEAVEQVERCGGMQIGWAVGFAVVGFCLVSGIEIVGKIIEKRK